MKQILLMTLLVVLTGCSSVKELVITKPEIIERPPLNVEQPRPATGYPVEFIIITRENFEDAMKKLEAEGKDAVFFALTDDGYKALSLSVAELRRYIQQQNAVVKAYKEYYEPAPANKK